MNILIGPLKKISFFQNPLENNFEQFLENFVFVIVLIPQMWGYFRKRFKTYEFSETTPKKVPQNCFTNRRTI